MSKINFNKGNILDVTSGIIVHGCNAQGVMGSGVAKQLREKYPEMYAKYKSDITSVFDTSESVGAVSWYSLTPGKPFLIASGITQEFYGRDISVKYVSYDAVHSVFMKVFNHALFHNLTVHIPDLIGCGLGGGNRDVVLAIIEDTAVRCGFPLNHISIWEFDGK